jgi:hypothetical protein
MWAAVTAEVTHEQEEADWLEAFKELRLAWRLARL